jgi:hypothetical protein
VSADIDPAQYPNIGKLTTPIEPVVRPMLARRIEHVRAAFPNQTGVLAYALRRARDLRVALGDGTALTRDLDGALLNEGDRILNLLAIADREEPEQVGDLERLVYESLDTL